MQELGRRSPGHLCAWTESSEPWLPVEAGGRLSRSILQGAQAKCRVCQLTTLPAAGGRRSLVLVLSGPTGGSALGTLCLGPRPGSRRAACVRATLVSLCCLFRSLTTWAPRQDVRTSP